MVEEHGKNWEKLATESTDDTENADANEAPEIDSDAAKAVVGGVLDHPDYQALQDKLTESEQLAHDNMDKALRAMSELENNRRRTEQDISNAHKYGIQKFAEALLPIIDSLEQALNVADDEGDAGAGAMTEGVKLTLTMFSDVFEKHGLIQLNPLGEAFDPNLHEAMKMDETADAKPGTVIAVYQKGYQLHDRVIRPARVVVAKAPSA